MWRAHSAENESGVKRNFALVPPPWASQAQQAGGAFKTKRDYINTHQTIDIIRGGRIGRQLLRDGDTNVHADTDGWIVAYFTKDELHGNAERNDRNT